MFKFNISSTEKHNNKKKENKKTGQENVIPTVDTHFLLGTDEWRRPGC